MLQKTTKILQLKKVLFMYCMISFSIFWCGNLFLGVAWRGVARRGDVGRSATFFQTEMSQQLLMVCHEIWFKHSHSTQDELQYLS